MLPYFIPEDWIRPPMPAGSQKRPVLLFVGRLVREKGVQTLLPVMASLPEVDLVVVGDGPLRGELERLAAPLRNVRFVGPKSGDGLRAWYAAARALVVPSLFPETFGQVVLEAWAHGVPVLVSPAGALPGVVAGGGGLVCDGAEAFRRAIRHWWDQPREAAAVGAVGRYRAEGEFGEEKHIARYLELVGESGRPGQRQ